MLSLVSEGDLGARVLVNDAGAAVGRTLAEIVNVSVTFEPSCALT